jgi:hypothetical protein
MHFRWKSKYSLDSAAGETTKKTRPVTQTRLEKWYKEYKRKISLVEWGQNQTRRPKILASSL